MRRIVTLIALAVAVLTGSLARAAETRLTPDLVLKRLREGNARYLTGISKHARIDIERRVETAKRGQKPYSTVLACSDSRVPTEVVFDQGFAEVFVVRVAGNVCDTAELASVEYGVEYLGTPLVVVLGHTQCGAVLAAVADKPLAGSLPKLVEMIRPAVEKARRDKPELKGDVLIELAIRDNVLQSMAELLRRSQVIRDKLKSGEIKVVGAVRNLRTGKVEWLGAHPNQAELIKG